MSLLKTDHQNPSTMVKASRLLRYELENLIIVGGKLITAMDKITIDIPRQYVIITIIVLIISIFLNY